MHKLIIADIKTPVTNGNVIGHWVTCARNYLAMFGLQKKTFVAGGPIYNRYFFKDLFELPYDLQMLGESKLVNKLKYFANARHLFKHSQSDTIVVQQGADATFFLACALFYSKEANNTLYLIQYSTDSIKGLFKKLLFAMSKHKMNGIICPNEEVGKAFGLPYCVVPDYIYTGTDVREQIPYSDKVYDICILGRIEREKGVVEAVRRLAKSSLQVVVAGQSSDPMLVEDLSDICKHTDTIRLEIGFVSDEAYNAYLDQSRFAVLNYSEEYSNRSSGVIYDILFHRVPIIGRQCKTMQLISEWGMGYVYASLEECDFSAIVTEANHSMYKQAIEKYLHQNEQYVARLGNFLQIMK